MSAGCEATTASAHTPLIRRRRALGRHAAHVHGGCTYCACMLLAHAQAAAPRREPYVPGACVRPQSHLRSTRRCRRAHGAPLALVRIRRLAGSGCVSPGGAGGRALLGRRAGGPRMESMRSQLGASYAPTKPLGRPTAGAPTVRPLTRDGINRAHGTTCMGFRWRWGAGAPSHQGPCRCRCLMSMGRPRLSPSTPPLGRKHIQAPVASCNSNA